jgi:hypothetical protein
MGSLTKINALSSILLLYWLSPLELLMQAIDFSIEDLQSTLNILQAGLDPEYFLIH